MHILIVDDSPSIRELLSAVFQQAGHQIATAESAELALPMLPYVDAVICDGLGGACWSVLEAAEGAGKRVVLYSGDGDLCHAAVRHGYPTLEKPARLEAILEAVCGVEVEAGRGR